MGKIKFKKPDIKGFFGKLKSLKWADVKNGIRACLLYTSPSPRDVEESRMPSSA